jgi:hypothetical protein|tara:strand:- start:287 stop:514 length:228 start_codon:yes stop_codon:yes gene_type:complete
LGFFGLTPEDKPKLHEQIFQLMYYGEGFNHSDLYEMPVYLRNFYYQKLLDTRKKENEDVKKANQKIKSSNPRFKR